MSNLKECGGARHPFTSTSMEPLKYDKVEYTYDKVNGGDMLVRRDYYMGSTLQFSHELEYDASGNLIVLTIV